MHFAMQIALTGAVMMTGVRANWALVTIDFLFPQRELPRTRLTVLIEFEG